jgi:hypothetical protein
VRLWDPQLGTELRTLDIVDGEVYALAWGQLNGRPALASSGNDGMVRLWDLERGTELRMRVEGPNVWRLAWGQLDGRPVLAIAIGSAPVQLWDPEQRGRLDIRFGMSGATWALAWGQLNGRPVLAWCNPSGPVQLWDPQLGTELSTVSAGRRIQALAWGQLGDRPVLASGGKDGTVRLWDPERDEELSALADPAGEVNALAWGQLNGRPVLASGGEDGTVRLWGPVVERIAVRLPTYRSDDPVDPDWLNRDNEAAALAEMIAAQSARPPLAIGLFGDWGEGKTHFLRRIADHVSDLAAIARNDPDDRLTHSAVRQVHFNAWHYAETDLWASLVTELFSQMAAGPGDPGVEERRQSRLAADLAARRRLPERLRAAQDRQQAIRQQLEEQADRQQAWLLRLDPQQQALLVGLAGDQPERLYQDMRGAARGVGGTARLAWQLCAIAVRRWWFWLGVLLVAAAIALMVIAPGPLGHLIGTFAGLAALVGTVIATVWSSITELRNKAKPVIEQVQQYAEDRRRRLQTALEVATAQVDALQAELQDLTPTGQLAALVERRSRRDGPYRAQLGMMTQIREDFEQMAHLLATASARSDPDAVGDELPRINRIVVYIDDLDRCPPDRVVEVLEAVQLLLAAPLFVVVVAVDPRWLLRSLSVHYRELFASADTDDASRDPIWGSTPTQYLEKIFQIPFTLPPVDQTGYTRMVDALTAAPSRADLGEPDPAADRTNSSLSAPSAADAGSPTAAITSDTGLQTLSAVPVVARFDPLALTDDERRLIALLGPPLVSTPRSIKRLVNSYGLLNALRGSHHAQDLTETIHDGTGSTYHPYRAAIALLGIVIAYPDLSPRFFPRLLQASSEHRSCSWPQFLKQISSERTADSSSSESGGALASEADALSWRKLVSALDKLTTSAAAIGLPLPEPLEAWAEWVMPVGRLSFETGLSVISLNQVDVATSSRDRESPPG